MRMTDMLLTETPRPCLDDDVFTEFTVLHGSNPVAIDITDPYALFVQMTMTGEAERGGEHDEDLGKLIDAFGSTTGHQIHEFFQFDWKGVIGCVAPPYENFVMEIDNRAGMERAAKDIFGIDPRKWGAELLHIGKTAVAFSAATRENWDNIKPHLGSQGLKRLGMTGKSLADLDRLDYRWIYSITTYRYEPGAGLKGPTSTYFLPVDHEGNLFYESTPVEEGHPPMPLMMAMGPRCYDNGHPVIPISDQYAMAQAWAVLVPAIFALTLMHTPRSTKDREGYHDLVEGEMPKAKVQRRFLEKNFRPMTRWHTLDVAPLREAIKRANGGEYPTSISGLRKALHSVRGHSATYMPNTYFGRKHDQPITVFRPAYVRGDARAGVVQKDLRVTT